MTRHEITKLQNQISGIEGPDEKAPRGAFLKDEVAYISEAIWRNGSHPLPKWALKFETCTPRYRRFRKTVTAEIGLAMKNAVERYHRLEVGDLEAEGIDTCAMDLVLDVRSWRPGRQGNRRRIQPRTDECWMNCLLCSSESVSY